MTTSSSVMSDKVASAITQIRRATGHIAIDLSGGALFPAAPSNPADEFTQIWAIDQVIAALAANRNITSVSLDLSGNNLTPTALNALLQALKQHNIPITGLSLHHNFFGDKGAEILAGWIPPTLECLDVSFNDINQTGFHLLTEAVAAIKPPTTQDSPIPGTTRLRKLDISYNLVSRYDNEDLGKLQGNGVEVTCSMAAETPMPRTSASSKRDSAQIGLYTTDTQDIEYNGAKSLAKDIARRQKDYHVCQIRIGQPISVRSSPYTFYIPWHEFVMAKLAGTTPCATPIIAEYQRQPGTGKTLILLSEDDAKELRELAWDEFNKQWETQKQRYQEAVLGHDATLWLKQHNRLFHLQAEIQKNGEKSQRFCAALKQKLEALRIGHAAASSGVVAHAADTNDSLISAVSGIIGLASTSLASLASCVLGNFNERMKHAKSQNVLDILPCDEDVEKFALSMTLVLQEQINDCDDPQKLAETLTMKLHSKLTKKEASKEGDIGLIESVCREAGVPLTTPLAPESPASDKAAFKLIPTMPIYMEQLHQCRIKALRELSEVAKTEKYCSKKLCNGVWRNKLLRQAPPVCTERAPDFIKDSLKLHFHIILTEFAQHLLAEPKNFLLLSWLTRGETNGTLLSMPEAISKLADDLTNSLSEQLAIANHKYLGDGTNCREEAKTEYIEPLRLHLGAVIMTLLKINVQQPENLQCFDQSASAFLGSEISKLINTPTQEATNSAPTKAQESGVAESDISSEASTSDNESNQNHSTNGKIPATESEQLPSETPSKPASTITTATRWDDEQPCQSYGDEFTYQEPPGAPLPRKPTAPAQYRGEGSTAAPALSADFEQRLHNVLTGRLMTIITAQQIMPQANNILYNFLTNGGRTDGVQQISKTVAMLCKIPRNKLNLGKDEQNPILTAYRLFGLLEQALQHEVRCTGGHLTPTIERVQSVILQAVSTTAATAKYRRPDFVVVTS